MTDEFTLFVREDTTKKWSFPIDLINDFGCLPLSQNIEREANDQEWKEVLNNLSQNHVEQQKPHMDGEVMGALAYELKNINEFENPSVIKPSDYDTLGELFQAVIFWWIYRQRKEPSTIKSRIAISKRMARHSIFPLDFFDLNKNQVIFYLDYREHAEKAGVDAIRNEWKTVKTFTKAYGFGDEIKKWNYTPPKKPKPKVKIVPLPPTVHKLMHYKYSSDTYTNALFQYIMTHSFLIGWRMPSEIAIMKIDDVFLDDGYIIIHEPKNDGLPRQIFPEKEIMTMSTRKSLKNWIDKWRPKVENQYSNDFLYLQSSGKPFTKAYLRKQLSLQGKKVWKQYHPYISRTWSCIARLIRCKLESGIFDIYDVQDFHGHSDTRVTEGYTQFAKRYYKSAPYDWIKAVLKSNFYINKRIGEENGLNRKNGKKPTFRLETLREKDTDLWGFEPQLPAPKAGRISRLPYRPIIFYN